MSELDSKCDQMVSNIFDAIKPLSPTTGEFLDAFELAMASGLLAAIPAESVIQEFNEWCDRTRRVLILNIGTTVKPERLS